MVDEEGECVDARLNRFIQWHCAPCFKVSSVNGLLFYPWGHRGQTYRVPTLREWEHLHRVMSIATLSGSALGLLPGWFAYVSTGSARLGAVLAGACSAIVIGAFLSWLRLTVRKLGKVTERLSAHEVSERRRSLMNRELAVFIFGTPASLMLLAIAVAVWDLSPRWGAALITVAAGGFIASLWNLRRSSARSSR